MFASTLQVHCRANYHSYVQLNAYFTAELVCHICYSDGCPCLKLAAAFLKPHKPLTNTPDH